MKICSKNLSFIDSRFTFMAYVKILIIIYVNHDRVRRPILSVIYVNDAPQKSDNLVTRNAGKRQIARARKYHESTLRV